MPLININIPAVATISGAVVGSAVYTALNESGYVAAHATSLSAHGVGFLAGKGMEYIAGENAGKLTQNTICFVGDQVCKPIVEKGSQKTAIVLSVAAGATAVAATYVIIVVGDYLVEKAITAIKSLLERQGIMEIDIRIREDEDDFLVIDYATPTASSSSDGNPDDPSRSRSLKAAIANTRSALVPSTTDIPSLSPTDSSSSSLSPLNV